MAESNSRSFAGIVRGAARQRRLMIPWVDDKRFVADGGTLVYAVDTDVLTLYLEPHIVAASTPDREGYAQVFPDDDPRLCIGLGRALAEYIFHSLSGEYPLLNLPAIDQEVRNTYGAILQQSQSEQAKASAAVKELQQIANELKNESNEVIVRRLVKVAPELVGFLAGPRGPSAELRRFGRLLKEARIAPMKFACEMKWADDITIEIISKMDDLKERISLRNSREAWFGRLRETKSKSTSNIRVYDDAEALAFLEQINVKMLDHKHRMVLVTGDKSLYEAARGYVPKGREERKTSFADLYLRHPRAYLAEPGVLSLEVEKTNGAPAEQTEILKWLDTFLAEVGADGEIQAEKLDALLEQTDECLIKKVELIPKPRPIAMKELKNKWGNYTRNLALDQGYLESDDEFEYDYLINLANNLQDLLDRVSTDLKRQVQATWEACFEAATVAGYGLLLYQSIAKPLRRGAPALSFDSFKSTMKFIKDVLRARARGQLTAIKFEDSINAVQKEDDNSSYCFYMAYALLFAAEGSWHITLILAERALGIAETKPHPRITGREAAYLKAVALRRNAKRADDLSMAEPLLVRAEMCLKEERKTRPHLQAGEIRFTSERRSIEVTYHLFRLFLNQPIPDHIPSLQRLQESFEALEQDVISRKQELSSTKCSLSPLTKSNEEFIVKRVERSVLTGLCITVLLRLGKEPEHEPLRPETLQAIFDCFRENVKGTKTEIDISFMSQAVYLAAGWLTETDIRDKRKWRKQLEKYLNDTAIEENIVAPYDRRFFLFLRELAANE